MSVKKINKFLIAMVILIVIGMTSIGCSKKDTKIELLIAAAASMEPVLKEIQELYLRDNSNIDLIFTYASSGALEQQIRQGAPIDLFISASQKQMNSLLEDDFIIKDTWINLLENKLVLITPTISNIKITDFKMITQASMIAMGDPNSVPAGQYAKEVLEYLSIYEEVIQKVTYGKDVTEVLAWVSSGNAEVGFVYKTDVISQEKVKVIAEAPAESHSKIIYPIAVIRNTKNKTLANDFLSFLQSKEVVELYRKYGFEYIASK